MVKLCVRYSLYCNPSLTGNNEFAENALTALTYGNGIFTTIIATFRIFIPTLAPIPGLIVIYTDIDL